MNGPLAFAPNGQHVAQGKAHACSDLGMKHCFGVHSLIQKFLLKMQIKTKSTEIEPCVIIRR